MCGYTNYQDPRLIPTDDGEEHAEFACDYDTCRHGTACKELLERVCNVTVDDGKLYWEKELATLLKCDECGEWEDM